MGRAKDQTGSDPLKNIEAKEEAQNLKFRFNFIKTFKLSC
jgi:hypothetical protein